MLFDDVEKLMEGLSDTSADSSSPKKNDDDDAKNFNLSTQDKGKKQTLLSSTLGKGKKGGIALKLTQKLKHIVML